MSKITDAVPTILAQLRQRFPNPTYALNWSNPLELLVATIMAAQCTDERVNQVTVALFRKYTTPRAYVDAETTDLAEDIRQISFNLKKAKRIQDVCEIILDDFNGQVPRTMDGMLTLPGVARKTANVVLTIAFNSPSGIIVDTHVDRVSRRLGLSKQKRPEKVEMDLMRLIPQDQWTWFGPALTLHGRQTCTAREPNCDGCIFNDLCEKNGLEEEEEE
jgi:endonuclease-3